MTAFTHLYGPFSDHFLIDVLAFFPLVRLFAVAGATAVYAVGFFFIRHNYGCFCASFFYLS